MNDTLIRILTNSRLENELGELVADFDLRGRDCLDFVSVSRKELGEMLAAAYRAGAERAAGPLAHSEHAALEGLKYSRKPERWEQVTATIRWTDLPGNLAIALARLPVYSAAWLGVDKWPLADFVAVPAGTLFVVRRWDDSYLVDTQGANYCRYAARLEP